MSAAPRKFRTPWTTEEAGEAYVVSDADAHPLAYVYFADDRRGGYFNNPRLTKDEARRVAANITKLPELLTIAKNAKSDFFPDVS